MEDFVVWRVVKKRLVRVTRKIQLQGNGGKGLYGGVLYLSSVSFNKQSAVVKVPCSSLDSADPESIDGIIDSAVKKQVGNWEPDYTEKQALPDKRYDDNYGNRKY